MCFLNIYFGILDLTQSSDEASWSLMKLCKSISFSVTYDCDRHFSSMGFVFAPTNSAKQEEDIIPRKPESEQVVSHFGLKQPFWANSRDFYPGLYSNETHSETSKYLWQKGDIITKLCDRHHLMWE